LSARRNETATIQHYLLARMAGNQKGQLPVKAGSLQGNTN